MWYIDSSCLHGPAATLLARQRPSSFPTSCVLRDSSLFSFLLLLLFDFPFVLLCFFFFFFLNNPPPPEIYPLPLHAPLPIPAGLTAIAHPRVEDPVQHVHEEIRQDHDDRDEHDEILDDRVVAPQDRLDQEACHARQVEHRSEEHTSELQSRLHLVCRLLLEKK